MGLAITSVDYVEYLKAAADIISQNGDYVTMAADRLNPDVAAYCQSYHPAVFRLISSVADAFIKEKKPLSICGELGGDALAVPALVGLGIRKLSMLEFQILAVQTLSGTDSCSAALLIAFSLLVALVVPPNEEFSFLLQGVEIVRSSAIELFYHR